MPRVVRGADMLGEPDQAVTRALRIDVVPLLLIPAHVDLAGILLEF